MNLKMNEKQLGEESRIYVTTVQRPRRRLNPGQQVEMAEAEPGLSNPKGLVTNRSTW